jgi:N-acetyl-gamma-glutamyl-phosphate reductase|tara:strand:+ start:74 stop:1108 length:1035 start_codon:yes stop_codon:yes gene_type:complete
MSLKKLNVGIIGATGFVGLDLINLLCKHPKISIKYICAQKNIGKNIISFDKRIKKKLPPISQYKNIDFKKLDLLFLSLPNGEAQKIIAKKYFKFKHIKFIDLSADFRITNPNKYQKWYRLKHKAPKLIKYSKYSISEFIKKDIKDYRIISNPGCYPTSIQLPLIPLLKEKVIKLHNIRIDSKSGFSGAGKQFELKFNFKNLYSSVFPYSVTTHKHMAELDQEFFKINKSKISYTFNPHILPTFRGILSSIYLETKKNINEKKVLDILKKFHKNNKFVKILKMNSPVGTNNVINTNNCEISICKSRISNQIVIFSALDNLIKGASGQAIQNMNLAYGFSETLGLK